jgi:hypothetical protein
MAIDIGEDGQAAIDEFTAANAASATRRAQFAAEGVILQLWSDGRLIGAWQRAAGSGFKPT